MKSNKVSKIKPVYLMLACTVIVVIVLAFTVFRKNDGGQDIQAKGDLVIDKSQITETAKFFPYQAGNIKMEVLAVKAPDGTVRTAFNTCQVCYSSGRGYYKQEGETLVCQNCGNRFSLDDIEKVRGGCNPVPILEGDKQDDGVKITIPEAFLKEYKIIFENWKVS